MDYILYNPVKHDYVKRVKGWPHSSFHRYVHLGMYNFEWAAEDDVRRMAMA
jgi:putative transposase